MVVSAHEKKENSVAERLYLKYGELMRLNELSEVLRYPTPESLRKAIARGNVPVATIKINNRRELFVKTEKVIEYLQSL